MASDTKYKPTCLPRGVRPDLAILLPHVGAGGPLPASSLLSKPKENSVMSLGKRKRKRKGSRGSNLFLSIHKSFTIIDSNVTPAKCMHRLGAVRASVVSTFF